MMDEVKARLVERITDLRDFVCSSRADSLEEYKRICGEIQGMSIAIDIIDETEDKLTRLYDQD